MFERQRNLGLYAFRVFIMKSGIFPATRNYLLNNEFFINLLYSIQLKNSAFRRWFTLAQNQNRHKRIIATACWDFPIYSQTFVYQEITQLIKRGHRLRFLYHSNNPREQLPKQFDGLWRSKLKITNHPQLSKKNYEYYKHKIPDRVEND